MIFDVTRYYLIYIDCSLQQKQYLFAASPFLELSEGCAARGCTSLTQQLLRTAAGSEKSKEEELTNSF